LVLNPKAALYALVRIKVIGYGTHPRNKEWYRKGDDEKCRLYFFMAETHCLIPVYNVNVLHACKDERIGYDDDDTIIDDEERKAAKPLSCVH